MLTFRVQDMTCGHCVRAITAAVQSVDTDAVLEFDLAAHEVRVESANASAESLLGVIKTAGYTPELATAKPIASVDSCASTSRKCCCG
jgi:copper chaperone